MIKHSVVIQEINSGMPFDCRYLREDGSITEFKGLCRPEKEGIITKAPADGRRSKRPLQNYLMLIPFQTPGGQVRELYTRFIVIFNNEEVML